MRLLLVEDDRDLAARLIRRLGEAGHIVEQVGDGERALAMGRTHDYALVILDIGLPRLSGLEVLRRWRAEGRGLPVLILTARDGWRERVEGLRAGADDYLGKPFEPEELLARIEAVIRRHHGHAHDRLQVDGLVLDMGKREVLLEDGRAVALTGTEFRLLRALMLRAGRVVARERLAAEAFEDGGQSGNTLEVYIRRLRCKLGEERIVTRRGQGYMLPDRERGE
ncbi:MAG: response regulator [Gammaproteobacteria bacterium]|nr:MAG: response regulator [Gammaproteobacteria bacterium]